MRSLIKCTKQKLRNPNEICFFSVLSSFPPGLGLGAGVCVGSKRSARAEEEPRKMASVPRRRAGGRYALTSTPPSRPVFVAPRYVENENLVVMMQSRVRGNSVRRHVREMHSAATTIQKHVRGHLTRRMLASQRKSEKAERVLMAARARRAARMRRREEEKLAIGGTGNDVGFSEWERRRAASVIQREWRHSRRRMLRAAPRPSARTKDRAARTIQRAYREYKSNKTYHLDEDNIVRAGGVGSTVGVSGSGGGVRSSEDGALRSFDEQRSMRIRLNFEKRVRARSAELTADGDAGGGMSAETAAREMEHARERLHHYRQLRYKHGTPDDIQQQQQRSSITFKRLTASALRLSDLSIDTLYSDIPLPPATRIAAGSSGAQVSGTQGRGRERGFDDGRSGAMEQKKIPRTRYELACMHHQALMEDALLESKGIVVSSSSSASLHEFSGNGGGGYEPGCLALGSTSVPETTTSLLKENTMENERQMWRQWRKYADVRAEDPETHGTVVNSASGGSDG